MTLKNPRHERFAQEIVKGKTATEVMAQLGYSDSRNSTQHKMPRNAGHARLTVEKLATDCLDVRDLYRVGAFKGVG